MSTCVDGSVHESACKDDREEDLYPPADWVQAAEEAPGGGHGEQDEVVPVGIALHQTTDYTFGGGE